jgi:hypothetical protein
MKTMQAAEVLHQPIEASFRNEHAGTPAGFLFAYFMELP